MVSGERLQRLPRWAADEIARLERDLASARGETATLLGGQDGDPAAQPGPSIYLREYRQGEPERSRLLLPTSRVCFRDRAGNVVVAGFDKNDRLAVRGEAPGHWADIFVAPTGGNTFIIDFHLPSHRGTP